MPDSWLAAKSATATDDPSTAAARPDTAFATADSAALPRAPRDDGGGDKRRFDLFPKAGPWRGQIGVGIGTHDHWETWLAVERDLVPDRVTFGFSTSAGSYPYGWYRPLAWDAPWR
jgi:hypothetical protein